MSTPEQAEYQRAYRLKNRDQLRAYDRERAPKRNIPEGREARNEYQRKYRAANPGKQAVASAKYRRDNIVARRAQDREFGFRKRYGFGIAERDRMLAGQGGTCASCFGSDTESKNGWHVDHCHTTGKIRSILCAGCNVALGHAKEDPVRLRLLADYIEKFK